MLGFGTLRFLPVLRLVMMMGGCFADFAAATLAAISRSPLVLLRVRYCLICPGWVCGAAGSCVVVGGGVFVVGVSVLAEGDAVVAGGFVVVGGGESGGDGLGGENGNDGVVGVGDVAMGGMV